MSEQQYSSSEYTSVSILTLSLISIISFMKVKLKNNVGITNREIKTFIISYLDLLIHDIM
jgi:hypothetical protein